MEQFEIDNVMTNLEDYLQSHHINTQRHFRCINPQHFDNNASMKFFNKDNKVYCFGCGASYNLVDCISIMEGIDQKEAFKKAIKTYSYGYTAKPYVGKEKTTSQEKDEKNYEKAFRYWHQNYKNNIDAKNYIASRGISEKTASDFKLGFNNFDFGDLKFNAVIIPINKNCFTARNIVTSDNELRYYKPKGCHIELFNLKALTNDKSYCVLTEGEFDCLSFETIDVNSMALCSANNLNKFYSTEKDTNKTYILALDNDSAGKNATNALIDYFKENNIKYKLFDNCGFKDANKALVEDRPNFEYQIKKIISDIEATAKRKKKQHDAEM